MCDVRSATYRVSRGVLPAYGITDRWEIAQGKDAQETCLATSTIANDDEFPDRRPISSCLKGESHISSDPWGLCNTVQKAMHMLIQSCIFKCLNHFSQIIMSCYAARADTAFKSRRPAEYSN